MRNLTMTFLLFVLTCFSASAQNNTYTIQKGETLSSIARKNKTTVQEIIRLNPDAAKGIKAGAVLQMPVNEGAEPKNTSPNSGEISRHEVKSGESLSRIAKKYKVTVAELEKWNGIKASSLKAGQEIVVSDPGTGAVRTEKAEKGEESHSGNVPTAPSAENEVLHKVAKGETLSLIARKYGTSVEAIRKANSLKSTQVNLNQELRIPVSGELAEKKPEAGKEVTAKIFQKPGKAQETKLETLTEPKKEEKQEASVPVSDPTKNVIAPNPMAVTPAPAPAETPVEQDKPGAGIREVNNTLGYTRIVETGFAEAIEGDVNSKKHLCLHKTAPIGSIIQVKNETNGQSVFVKVVGKLPETGSNEKLIIRVSRQAYERLMATGKRFPVEVSYPQAQ